MGLLGLVVAYLTLVIITSVMESRLSQGEPEPFSDDLVEYINSVNATWKAGDNFEQSSLEGRKFYGELPDPEGLHRPPTRRLAVSRAGFPKQFDARTAWPKCSTIIGEIRNQGSCGCCWAISSAAAMSDRICIASKGKVIVRISVEDIVSCCGDDCGKGCFGGWSGGALKFFQEHGVVTGGAYNSQQGCQPYTIEACEHHNVTGDLKPCRPSEILEFEPTPCCKNECISGYQKTYKQDKYYGKAPYTLEDEDQMKTELMKNGPVVASFDVFADFLSYKSGVYSYVTGERIYGHVVKVIGWGVENGTPYWLVANSWNESWGDKGFFKIKRGSNECGFEDWAIAAEVKI